MSTIYTPPIRPEDIVHRNVVERSPRKNHKYKNRFWKNGRWQYIYDEITGENANKREMKARKIAENARKEHGSHINNYEHKYRKKYDELVIPSNKEEREDVMKIKRSGWRAKDAQRAAYKATLDNSRHPAHAARDIANQSITAAYNTVQKGKRFFSKLFK